VDYGHNYKNVGRIYPFHDRPDIAVRVLWFPVSLDAPSVPFPSPFVLRTWDRLEQEPQTKIGTDQEYRERYDGPLPINLPGTVCGTAEQWANGLSYAEWLVSHPACDCPEMIFMSAVSSVRNDDGSLVVAPNVGDVEAHLNVGHENNWSVRQTFRPAVVGHSALEISGIAGQTEAYARVFRSGGELLQTLHPGVAEIDAVFALFAVDGSIGFSVDTAGSMELRNPTTNVQERVVITTEVNRAVFFGALRNRYGNAFNEGYATFATDPGGNMAGQIHAAVNCIRVPGGSHVVFSASDDATLGGTALFQIFGGLTAQPDSFVGINVGLGTVPYAFLMNKRKEAFGVAILQDVTGASVHPPFALCDHLGAEHAGWREDGTLFSDDTIAPAALGALTARWPVYDSAGSLVGYIPLYS
jgi:hypothetical protein